MIIINVIGLSLIVLIIWWFWLYKPNKTVVTDKELLIVVKDGVYAPSVIEVQAGSPLTLKFNRKDASPCSETVLIPALDISASLKLNDITSVAVPALAVGKYEFHCQMQMYRGVIKVV
jgi:plastocyanin domain-containing protein